MWRTTHASGKSWLDDISNILIPRKSCRFIPREGDHDYLDIVPGGGGCYAQIPYWPGRGRMEVNWGIFHNPILLTYWLKIGLEQDGCVYMSVVVHELLHTLGVKHEQSRPDRDDYITIHWDNMKVGLVLNNTLYFLPICSQQAQVSSTRMPGLGPTPPPCQVCAGRHWTMTTASLGGTPRHVASLMTITPSCTMVLQG